MFIRITVALLEAKDTLEITPISKSLLQDDIHKKIDNIKTGSRKRKRSASVDGKMAKFIKLTGKLKTGVSKEQRRGERED